MADPQLTGIEVLKLIERLLYRMGVLESFYWLVACISALDFASALIFGFGITSSWHQVSAASGITWLIAAAACVFFVLLVGAVLKPVEGLLGRLSRWPAEPWVRENPGATKLSVRTDIALDRGLDLGCGDRSSEIKEVDAAHREALHKEFALARISAVAVSLMMINGAVLDASSTASALRFCLELVEGGSLPWLKYGPPALLLAFVGLHFWGWLFDESPKRPMFFWPELAKRLREEERAQAHARWRAIADGTTTALRRREQFMEPKRLRPPE